MLPPPKKKLRGLESISSLGEALIIHKTCEAFVWGVREINGSKGRAKGDSTGESQGELDLVVVATMGWKSGKRLDMAAGSMFDFRLM